MRVRKQHAWGAILIALFALPVLKPDGVPTLERPVAGFFAWFGGVTVLNPRLWGSDTAARDVAEGGTRARALEVENALLREHLVERLQDQADLGAMREALQLAGLDRLPRAVPARVLRSADPSGYRRSILIDRGEVDGLRQGHAVVSGAVFLGRVEVVHARSALVKLITDRRSRIEVAVRTDRNVRLTGYVRGRGRGAVEEDLLVRDVHAPAGVGRVVGGIPVVTSNADARVPAGLLVGTVAEVHDKDLDEMPTIRIHPALDLARSTRVIVLVPE